MYAEYVADLAFLVALGGQIHLIADAAARLPTDPTCKYAARLPLIAQVFLIWATLREGCSGS